MRAGTAGPRRDSVRAPSPPRTKPLAAGLGFEDHFLHHVIQPGELARLSHAGLAEHDRTATIDQASRAVFDMSFGLTRGSRAEFIGSSPCVDG